MVLIKALLIGIQNICFHGEIRKKISGYPLLSGGIISDIFLDHWAHYCIFENGVLLMHTLEGISSVANFITAYEGSQ